MHRDRDAGPRSAEHDAEELVRKRDVMVIQAIVSQEKPAGQPFLDFVTR